MFKRMRWLATGLVVGAGGSVWAQRKAKEVASRYAPAGVAQDAANRALDALKEGRTAMREREAQLRRAGPWAADGRVSRRP